MKPQSAVIEPLPPVPLGSVTAQPRVNGNVGNPEAAPTAQLSYGQPSAISLPANRSNLAGGTVALNFADTDIREAVKQILRNILKVTYTIDPDVHGSATLLTAQPLPMTQLLPVLQSLLAQNGATLTETGGIYRVVRVSNPHAAIPGNGAAKGLGADAISLTSSDALSGTTIVPLRYADAANLAKMLQPFITSGASIIGDPARDVVLISGDPSARATLISLVQAFDIDLLAHQSYALLPVTNGDAKDFATSLDEAFRSQGNAALANVVRVVPMTRVNAVLVIASEPQYIDDARRVYALVEHMRRETGRSWHVYYLRDSRAEDIAYILQQAFTPNNVAAQPPNTRGNGAGYSGAASSGGLGSTFGGGAALGGGLGKGPQLCLASGHSSVRGSSTLIAG